MMAEVQFFLGAFGLAYIFGFSKISLPFREFLARGGRATVGEWVVSLMECPACLGFWTGLLYGLVVTTEPPLVALGRGLYTCGANFLLAKLSGLIQEEDP